MYLDDCIKNSNELSSTTKLFLHTLASYADKRGVCYPSQTTIAQAMSMSLATVKRCLQECLELRLLEVKRRWRKSNVYKLLCLKKIQFSTIGSNGEPREQPPLVQNNVQSDERNKVLTAEKLRWVSPREISLLLQDIQEVMGSTISERNRGWFIKIIRSCSYNSIQDGLKYVKQSILESDILGTAIHNPSGLFCWYLRNWCGTSV
jgi:hypothetical protein